MTEKHTI